MNRRGKSILVAGLPRAGTTWLAELLSEVARYPLIHEPDNELSHPLGFLFKKQTHRFPSAEEALDSDVLEVFRRAFNGWTGDPRTKLVRVLIGRKYRWSLERWVANKCGMDSYFSANGVQDLSSSLVDSKLLNGLSSSCMPIIPWLPTQPRVVKSVHAVRILEHVSAAVNVNPVILLRNPYAVVASLNRMVKVPSLSEKVVNADRFRGLPEVREVTAETIDTLVARQVAYLLQCAAKSYAKHSDWCLISHDHCCRDIHSGLTTAADHTGLKLSSLIAASNKKISAGAGYDTSRSSMIEQIDKWKNELSDHQIDCVDNVIKEFELEEFLGEHDLLGNRGR